MQRYLENFKIMHILDVTEAFPSYLKLFLLVRAMKFGPSFSVGTLPLIEL